jgi:hypothetical protein
MEQTLQRGLSMDKKRDSFTFQRYYFEAISTFKSKERLELYDAICAYVFEEKDATLNSKKEESCFILIKHLLDEERKKAILRQKDGLHESHLILMS